MDRRSARRRGATRGFATSDIYQTCSQISKMADDPYPAQRVLEWDDADSLLEIIDPYLLFYLRWSGRLQALAEG